MPPRAARYAEAQARLDEWPRIDAPVSFLYGVDDGCEIAAPRAGATRDMFTQAYDRSELPGAGHFLPRERPDAVAAAIRLRLQQSAGSCRSGDTAAITWRHGRVSQPVA